LKMWIFENVVFWKCGYTVIFQIRADQNTPPLSGSEKKSQKRPYLGQGLLSFGLWFLLQIWKDLDNSVREKYFILVFKYFDHNL
jgi:hypothetical protein